MADVEKTEEKELAPFSPVRDFKPSPMKKGERQIIKLASSKFVGSPMVPQI